MRIFSYLSRHRLSSWSTTLAKSQRRCIFADVIDAKVPANAREEFCAWSRRPRRKKVAVGCPALPKGHLTISALLRRSHSLGTTSWRPQMGRCRSSPCFARSAKPEPHLRQLRWFDFPWRQSAIRKLRKLGSMASNPTKLMHCHFHVSRLYYEQMILQSSAPLGHAATETRFRRSPLTPVNILLELSNESARPSSTMSILSRAQGEFRFAAEAATSCKAQGEYR